MERYRIPIHYVMLISLSLEEEWEGDEVCGDGDGGFLP